MHLLMHRFRRFVSTPFPREVLRNDSSRRIPFLFFKNAFERLCNFSARLVKTVLLPTIGRYVEAQVKPLRERIEALEASGIKYVGVYQRAAEYKRGDVVSHEGSMWVATCAVTLHETPGKSVAAIDEADGNAMEHGVRMIVDKGGTDEEVESFREWYAQVLADTRASNLAKVRAWLLREGETLQ